jgi:hypothetical protein
MIDTDKTADRSTLGPETKRDTAFFRKASMNLRVTEAVARSVSENIPCVNSNHNSYKAYQIKSQSRSGGQNTSKAEIVNPRRSEPPTDPKVHVTKAIKLSIIKKLHRNSNAGLVSIRDVSKAVDEILS